MNKPHLEGLNPAQLKAATTLNAPVLILAGAGSGKTKTIIARTIEILDSGAAKSNEILVATFTNKAAREMLERGRSLLGESVKMPNFTTFHSWGVKFLKWVDPQTLSNLGINANFTIIDQDEQVKILNNIKVQSFPEPIAKAFKAKDFLLTLGNFQNHSCRYDSKVHAIKDISVAAEEFEVYTPEIVSNPDQYISDLGDLYYRYKKELRRNNSLDFEDLINLSIQVLKSNKEIRDLMHQKYKFIMVDEFQDTNGTQFELIKLLLGKNSNICVVGDDSQSIYGWRGAKISYIINFAKYFPSCEVVNLSINYRSFHSIITKANKLLTHAIEKHSDKLDLVSHFKDSGSVTAYMVDNEGAFVSNAIKKALDRGVSPGEFTILYRSAFVIRDIEAHLIKNGIPYNIHNGKALMTRVAARCIIAYLKSLQNDKNSLSISIFLELSGILTQQRLSTFYAALEEDQTLFEYLKSGDYKKQPRITAKIKVEIDGFVEEFEKFKKMSYSEFKRTFNNSNAYKKRLLLQSTDQKKEKESESNLNVLSVMGTLINSYDSLDKLLEILALEGEKSDTEEDKVNLMTIHASKGLEFGTVFLLSAAEGVFPSERSDAEEELRLFYVAVTRARHKMIVTCPHMIGYGAKKPATISRFVQMADIPLKTLEKPRRTFY